MENSYKTQEINAKDEQSGNLSKIFKSWLKNALNIGTNSSSLRESIEEAIEEHGESSNPEISSEEKIILKNVLDFSESKVGDIMIPRTDIVAVGHEISLSDLTKKFIEEEHTRMPVYKDSLDNVIGFIHVKDIIPIIAAEKQFEIDKIIRELLIISPTMKNIDLLAKMKLSRVHMALVLDEYGGTDGLVTFEDLAEEILGEIKDEHDYASEPDYVKIDNNLIEASARISIEKLEELLNLSIADKYEDDFDTVGGLILSMVGYVPVRGEKVEHSAGLLFEILDSDPRRIKRVLIRKNNS